MNDGTDTDHKKTRLVICTVGVSLRDKLKNSECPEAQSRHQKVFAEQSSPLNAVDGPLRCAKLDNGDLVKSCNKIIDHLTGKWKEKRFQVNEGSLLIDESMEHTVKKARRESPAEIASLHDLLKGGDGYNIDEAYDNRVIFLCSDTKEGAFCARCLMGFVSHKEVGWARCDPNIFSSDDLQKNDNLGKLISCGGLVLVAGLSISEKGEFQEKGLTNLVGALSLILVRWMKGPGVSEEQESGEEAERHVSIVATGGFKPESIYAALVGSLFDVAVYYLHETSMSNLLLPALPVDYDALTWAEHRDIISAIESNPIKEMKGLRDSLPDNIGRLFEERGDGGYRLNPFGRIVNDLMRERIPTLSRYGKGMLLIDRVRDESLRKKLVENIQNRWQYVWLGDRIPETVEHARGHVQRLLGFAAQLLEPIFAQEDGFLNDAELFVLISAIWLHDIGHAATTLELNGEAKDIARLPTVVRDLHHILTHRMLVSSEDDEYGLEEPWKEVVAGVCKYHRGKMPVREGHEHFQDEASGIRVENPIESVMNVGDSREVRARLLASLLRVIDACDVQEERIVDEGYAKARKALTQRELEAERKRLLWLRGRIRDGGGLKDWYSAINDKVDCFAEKVGNLLNCKTEDFETKNQDYEKLRNSLRDNLNAAVKHVWSPTDGGEEKDPPGLLEMWVESASRLLFKAEQDVHFFMHRQVRQVAILPQSTFRNGNGFNFSIKLWPNEGHIPSWVEKIKRDIKCELKKVEGNLRFNEGSCINMVVEIADGDGR